jgi:S-adenosylmethionine decarboxylase
MVFGKHVTLDLCGCNDNLKDLQLHFDLLNDLPEKIGMTKVTVPYVMPYKGIVPEDAGITGFCVIAESHISIHSFEKKNYCFVDIFSCKTFDVDKAVNVFIKAFDPLTHSINVITRGVDFPR